MSLQFNVSQLLKDSVGERREYEFHSDQPISLDEGVAGPVDGTARFILTNLEIVAKVRARARLHLTCARCLEPFQTTREIEFEEEYSPSIDIATGLPSPVPLSDTAFLISQNHTIDLSEAIRQNFLVAVELIPICKDDCAGLCPECGVNRNLEACKCRPDESASPFAVLQKLVEER